MKFIGYTLLGLFCIVLAAVTFLFVAAPVGFVRDQMIAAVERETGRILEIRGETAFSFYPKLGVTLGDVSLSAPPGMGGPPTLTTRRLKVNMPVMALLNRELVVEEFILDEPVIDLRVDADGRKSWDVARTTGARTTGARTTGARTTGAGKPKADDALSPELQDFIKNSSDGEKAPADTRSSDQDGLKSVSLGDVRINDGTLRYSDARSGTAEVLTGVDLKVGLERLDAPLELSGRGTWHGDAVSIESTVTTLELLRTNTSAKVDLRMVGRYVQLRFNGRIDPRDDGAADGRIDLTVPSVPGLQAWVADTKPGQGAIKTASLKGRLRATSDVIQLEDATFVVNDLDGAGQLRVRLGDRPDIKGEIAVKDINTASFLGKGTSDDNDPIGKLSGGDGGRSGDVWSETPIDFKGLRAADADLNIRFASLVHNDIRLDKGDIRLGLQNGRLAVRADPVALYGGATRGEVVIDARQGVPTYRAALKADRLSALPLLKAFAGFDWLSGATGLDVNVQGRGLSQKQMMRTMNGTAAFQFSDGAIEGMNIAKILRGVQNGKFRDFDRVSGEKTDFSDLSASFRITNGVAANQDLTLRGPLVRASGAGQADLGARTIAYRLTPKLVASLEGQGGSDLSGLSIPLQVQGPWSRPRVVPDINGILQNPDAAASAINSIGKALGKSKSINSDKAKKALDKILGGDGSSKKSPLGGLLGDFIKSQ